MKKINVTFLFFVLSLSLLFTACSDDDESISGPMVEVPTTYDFSRNGSSTVSFKGQTTRIKMATELVGSLKDFNTTTIEILLEMYRNETADGEDTNPFNDTDLNESAKSVKSKVAASRDFFSANTVDAAAIKNDFESWMANQISEVFPNENQLAAAGIPGQLADGGSTRYVNSEGLEYDQMVTKGLIGALMVDQMLNNYLGTAVLDEGDNITHNDNGQVADGENYTTMEHKWDEAYGYLYGTSANPADPNLTIGDDDAFLNKYVGRVEGDADFAGIAAEIFNAFKLGRAAIVAGDYDLRDQQAVIIREKVSAVIGIRAVYYLQQGKNAIDQTTPDYGAAFHDLSEGYGFVYSLMFTRKPGTDEPFFTKPEVEAFLTDLLDDGPNGLWNVQSSTLDAISNAIAGRFEFTVDQAGS